MEETLRIADFVGRGKDVGASGKRTFPMANPRAGWKPYAYVTGLKPAAEDRRDTHRLARAWSERDISNESAELRNAAGTSLLARNLRA